MVCTNTCAKSHDLFTGFPRTVIQAEKLGERQQLDVVVNLDVPFETIIDRISVSLLTISIILWKLVNDPAK